MNCRFIEPTHMHTHYGNFIQHLKFVWCVIIKHHIYSRPNLLSKCSTAISHLTRYVPIPGYKFSYNNRDKGKDGEIARSWIIH